MIPNSNQKVFEMNTSIRNSEDLGKIVRETRKAQKLSQENLAGMANTGRRFIVDLEKGRAYSDEKGQLRL